MGKCANVCDFVWYLVYDLVLTSDSRSCRDEPVRLPNSMTSQTACACVAGTPRPSFQNQSRSAACLTKRQYILFAMATIPICYSACGTAWAGCYAAAGLVAGTIVASPAAPAAALACNAAASQCMMVCAGTAVVQGFWLGPMGAVLAGTAAAAVAGGQWWWMNRRRRNQACEDTLALGEPLQDITSMDEPQDAEAKDPNQKPKSA